jgi:leucyl/phenylalanyl-tRNA--protein transferase
MSTVVPWLDAAPDAAFPSPATASPALDGLLAAGGDLSPERLLRAYRQGIFPWFSSGQPILWWCPEPRMVFRTQAVHLSDRFRRQLRRCGWIARADTAFDQVIRACADIPRRGQRGTWITRSMMAAYMHLHALGHAHSVEVFEGEALVGGIYGVAIGRMFFGESMFSARSGGSKMALGALAFRLRAWGWPLIDAQVENPHLLRMGAEAWPRSAFLERVASLAADPEPPGPWTSRFGTLPANQLAG